MTAADPWGCPRCYQASAEALSEEWSVFREVSRLIDESHFIVRVLSCLHCGQRFVSVFTETIDWSEGDDSQYWSLLPLTMVEAEQLIAQGENVDIRLIESLGSERRYLQVDHPTREPKRVMWCDGHLSVVPHD